MPYSCRDTTTVSVQSRTETTCFGTQGKLAQLHITSHDQHGCYHIWRLYFKCPVCQQYHDLINANKHILITYDIVQMIYIYKHHIYDYIHWEASPIPCVMQTFTVCCTLLINSSS